MPGPDEVSNVKVMLPERFHRLRSVLDRRQPDLTVLMERVNKPHNLSAILRNCDAVGVLEAHAVPPERGLSLDNETSAGTAKWIPVHRHPDAPTALAALRASGHQLVAAHPGITSVDYRDIDFTRPTAIIVGAELFGLSPETIAEADRTVSIPMTGMARSLNVSVATALLLYEAYRQRDNSGHYDAPRLDPTHRDRLLFEWAYPEIAERFRVRGLPYPEIDQDGGIVGSLDPIRKPLPEPDDR